MDRLPPLNSLRAFDAAARHMSFAKAADELSVTPAALSYQIKSLEDHLGAPLFRRLNRAVELTEAGEMLAKGVDPGFSALRGAWRRVRAHVTSPLLVVTAGPAFTAKWLAPKLYAFALAHPDFDLRLTASLKLLDFDRDGIDVAIRFGRGQDLPGCYVQTIMDEWVTPMMHPEIARKMASPADLAGVPLIHQEDLSQVEPGLSWSRWLGAAGVEATPTTGARFSQADHALDAAAAGAGAVLGRISLAARDLAEGRLVAPFDLAFRLESRTRFICPKGAETRPAVRAFLDWIVEETRIDPSMEAGRLFIPLDEVKA